MEIKCEICGNYITELAEGGIFWSEASDVVHIAHKRCYDDDLWIELWWLADFEAALWQLTKMITMYQFASDQIRRLSYAALLIATTADDEYRKRAVEYFTFARVQ